MEEIKLTKEELERMYQYPPKDFEKETDFQQTHRMGRNSIINELIDKIEKSKQNQYKLNMENLGKFIDDIRKEIKWLNVSFEEVPFGEAMVLTTPPSSKKYIVDTRKIGKIEYDTPMYSELLEMTIEQLKRFNESDENLNISDVMNSILNDYQDKLKDITTKIENMIKRLLEKLNLIKQQKPKLVIADVIDSNFDKTKIVKVKIKYPYQFDDIIEEVDINVPIGLSEEDENKFIDDVIERDYAYLYGR